MPMKRTHCQEYLGWQGREHPTSETSEGRVV